MTRRFDSGYIFFMKTDRLIILSFVLLAFGLGWLAGHWNGSMSFHASLPAAGSLFEASVTNKGSSALIGVLFTLFGVLTLFITFVAALFNIAAAGRR